MFVSAQSKTFFLAGHLNEFGSAKYIVVNSIEAINDPYEVYFHIPNTIQTMVASTPSLVSLESPNDDNISFPSSSPLAEQPHELESPGRPDSSQRHEGWVLPKAGLQLEIFKFVAGHDDNDDNRGVDVHGIATAVGGDDPQTIG